MFLPFSCRQCGRRYFPYRGPATVCPNCGAQPTDSEVQVIAWYTLALLLLLGIFAYAADESVRGVIHQFVAGRFR